MQLARLGAILTAASLGFLTPMQGVVPAAPIDVSAAPAPATAPAPASAPSSQESHAHHRFTDTERYVKMWEDPARGEWQKPDEVVSALELSRGDTVADIGAGSGYFSFRIARAVAAPPSLTSVAADGKVFAVDIEPGMIDYLKKRAIKEKAPNVVAVLADRDDARLAPGSIDLAFICDTWHHIDDRVAYLRRLSAALKPGALIAVVDYQKRPLPLGPPLEAKIDRADVVKEFQKAGFELVREHSFLPYQYFLVFGKPGMHPHPDG
jgi:ubiquinone/menaquinone biosynthesis C-methylase UbiE